MICISFNIKGLGASPKFRALKIFLLNNKEGIYLFQETMYAGTKAYDYFLKILKYWE